MRKLVRFFIYGFVILGAFYFFKWLRPSHSNHDNAAQSEQFDHETDGNGRAFASGETVMLDDFSEVSISGAYDVHLVKGDEPSIRIETSDEVLEKLSYSVIDHKLVLTTRKGNWHFDDDVNVYITASELSALNISGGVELETVGVFESETFSIEVSGAADLNMNLVVDQLEMGLSGAANAELQGSANSARYAVSGAGHIEADDFPTRSVQISLSGAGAAELNAQDKLDVKISGAGSVSYKGDPELHKRISGLGSVRKN